jgi:hypothetical protein
MKNFLIVTGMICAGMGAWLVLSRLSADAVGMAVGLLFGVLAGVPTWLLLWQAQQRQAERRRWADDDDASIYAPYLYQRPERRLPADLAQPWDVDGEIVQRAQWTPPARQLAERRNGGAR